MFQILVHKSTLRVSNIRTTSQGVVLFLARDVCPHFGYIVQDTRASQFMKLYFNSTCTAYWNIYDIGIYTHIINNFCPIKIMNKYFLLLLYIATDIYFIFVYKTSTTTTKTHTQPHKYFTATTIAFNHLIQADGSLCKCNSLSCLPQVI